MLSTSLIALFCFYLVLVRCYCYSTLLAYLIPIVGTDTRGISFTNCLWYGNSALTQCFPLVILVQGSMIACSCSQKGTRRMLIDPGWDRGGFQMSAQMIMPILKPLSLNEQGLMWRKYVKDVAAKLLDMEMMPDELWSPLQSNNIHTNYSRQSSNSHFRTSSHQSIN